MAMGYRGFSSVRPASSSYKAPVKKTSYKAPAKTVKSSSTYKAPAKVSYKAPVKAATPVYKPAVKAPVKAAPVLKAAAKPVVKAPAVLKTAVKPAVPPPVPPNPGTSGVVNAGQIGRGGTGIVNSHPLVPSGAKLPGNLAGSAGSILKSAAQSAINGQAAKTASAMKPLPGAANIIKSGALGALAKGVTLPGLKTGSSLSSSNNTSGGINTGGGTGTVGGTPATAAPSVPNTTPPATAPVVTPPVVTTPTGTGGTGTGGNQNQTVNSYTATGNTGTVGQSRRLREARGPMTGLSVTPELLRRAAQSKFSRTS